jgi:hypothetical protein
LQQKRDHPFLVGSNEAFLRDNRFFHCLRLSSTRVFPLFKFIFKSPDAPLLLPERDRYNDLVKSQQKPTTRDRHRPKKITKTPVFPRYKLFVDNFV